jgi:hypothetical protein
VTKRQYITEELAAMGLRWADQDEPGWFVTVFNGERHVKIWATDL